jgi:hypothetical protein
MQGRSMPCAASPLGASGPVIHRLSHWMPLITTPEVVVGRLLGSISLDTSVDRSGWPIPVPCDAPTMLRDA